MVYIMNFQDAQRMYGWKDPNGGMHYDAPKAVTGADGKATGASFNPFTHSNKDLAKNYDLDVWRDAYEASGRDMKKIDKMAEKYNKIEKLEEKISKLQDKINDTDNDKKIEKYEKEISKLQEKISKINSEIDELDGGESERQDAALTEHPTFDSSYSNEVPYAD